MGERGPGASKVLDFKQNEKPKPDGDMSKVAKKVWKKIVADLPSDHFIPADLPLFRAYCEAYATHIEASKKLEEEGCVISGARGGSIRNPWFDIQKESSAVMATMATKLRLCVNSRISYKKAASLNKLPPKSKRKGLMFTDKK